MPMHEASYIEDPSFFVVSLPCCHCTKFIQFLTCTRIPCRDSHCENGLVSSHAKTVADHQKCDSENQDQLSNTGDSVAAIQDSNTEFDDDDSSSFRLYR